MPECLGHPVGTGPYHIVKYNPNQRLIWDRTRRNLSQGGLPFGGEPGDKEAGLLDDAGKALPLNDRLVVTIFEELQPMWLTFLKGGLTGPRFPKTITTRRSPGDMSLAPDLKARGIRLTKTVEGDVVTPQLQYE